MQETVLFSIRFHCAWCVCRSLKNEAKTRNLPKSDALAPLSVLGKVLRPEPRGEITGAERTLQNNPRVRQKTPSWADDVSRIDCVCVVSRAATDRKTNSLMDQGDISGMWLAKGISALLPQIPRTKQIPFRIAPDPHFLSN